MIKINICIPFAPGSCPGFLIKEKIVAEED